MRPKSKIYVAFLALLVFFASKGFGQLPEQLYAAKITSYIFSSDSVAGFDEPAASAGALAVGSYGVEYKAYMYNAKRIFIKQKYNLKSVPAAAQTIFQNQIVAKTTAAGGACDNEDFELATSPIFAPGPLQGWVPSSGSNAFLGCGTIPMTGTGIYTVYTSPTIDPVTGIQVGSYFDAGVNGAPAGHSFIQLNDIPAGSTVSRITKTFIVTSANALFEYAYLPIIQDGSHTCCQQAGFDIQITITNTATSSSTVLACPQISVAVPSSLCNFVPPQGSPVFVTAPSPNNTWLYHNWAASVIDLTPYINNQVDLQVTVRDCDQTGHTGYCYFDAKCLPMTVIGNNNSFPAGTPSITLPTCGATSATICAPDGVGPYSWAGPGIVAPYTNPSLANQCLTVNISANFTLTMDPPGACNPINRILTVTITPSPYALTSVTQAVCGSTSAIVGYTAAGSASVNPVIIWSPAPTSSVQLAVNLGYAYYPPGIGVVTVTALDPLGCRATSTINVNAAIPVPTVSILNVTGSPSITCTTPSVDLSAVSNYTFNSLNYFWSSNSFTGSTQDINVTTASTLITLTVIDAVTGCVGTATTSIRVNTVIPNISVNPNTQNILCGPGVVATATGVAISPSINVTQCWYPPGGGIPSCSGGQISIFNPPIVGANGISTLVVTDNINGCSNSRTVEVISLAGGYPVFGVSSVGSANQFTLGCSTKSVTDINIIDADTYPGTGGAISFTVLAPSFSGSTYTTATINTFSTTGPGNYTVIVRDDFNNCETRLPLPVLQNIAGPDITVSAITRTLSCDIPSVTLTASSPTGVVTYAWKANQVPPLVSGNTISINTTTAGASVASATLIDTYTLTGLNGGTNGNQCITTTLIPMYQNTRPPKPDIANIGPITCLINMRTLTNAGKTGILVNTFPITAAPSVTLWEGPTPQLPQNGGSSYAAYTPGPYTMTVRDPNNGCISTTIVSVGDNKVYPVISTNSISILDCGAIKGDTLKARVLGLTPGDVDAIWIAPPTGSTSALNSLTLVTTATGPYYLSVTTKTNGCSSSAGVTVIDGSLTAGFTPDQSSGYAPMTVNFSNTSASSSSVSGSTSITAVWSFGNGSTRTTTSNVSTSATYNQPGTYTITMFASKGSCRDTLAKTVFVDIPSKLEVPNVFTPNGDNSNDIFFVHTANLSQISAYIYDRWGNKIYELSTDKGNIAWDGKTQAGKEAPDGTYFYVITAKGKDGQSYDTKGTVSLYR